MVKITYEDKMNYLDSKRIELIQRSKKYTSEVEYDKYFIDVIECIMEDVRDFKTILEQSKDNYKHWNLFFNGKTGQYLLYLYVDRKSDMLEIDRTLYEKIKEKVGS